MKKLGIIEKIAEFYQKNNFFKIENNLLGNTEVEENEFDVFLKIKKNKESILNDVNFIFLKDDEEWDIVSFFDKKSPLVFINTNSSKNISYLVVYSIALLMVGLSIKINFKNIEASKSKSELLHFLDSIASNSSLNKTDFDIHYFVDDYFADKIFTRGKRFCFSVVLAFEKNLINENDFADLIGIKSGEIEEFFSSYLPLALLTNLKQRA